jgi:hypothetical protein
MAFLFADLTAIAAALAVDALFGAAGSIPETRPSREDICSASCTGWTATHP